MLEKEGNKEEAIMFYEQAADLFATENSTSEANKCNLKVRAGRLAGRWAVLSMPARPQQGSGPANLLHKWCRR